MVSFAVTRECNLKCKHCYSDANASPYSNELDTAEAKRVITEIAQAGAHLLIFDGGEPLMRDDIYELIAHANDSGLQPVMGTNATRLSTEAADRIRKAGVKAVAVSLYGSDAKSHDDFCGREGIWDRVMAGIRNINAAGIPLQINTTIHRNNLDQLDAIIHLSRELGAMAVEVFRFLPTGRGKEHPDLALPAEGVHHLIGQLIQHQLNDQNMAYRCVGIPQYWVEVEKTAIERIIDKEAFSRLTRSCCGAALRYCCVYYEGTVYPCMALHKAAGNVREKSFPEIWQGSEVFNKLRGRNKLGGKCGQCDYRQICGGARCIVFEKTGSLTREDRKCWFEKEELARIVTVQEAGCAYCESETLSLCQVCHSPICETDSLSCPFCQSRLCHPDVKDCFFKHRCQ